MLRRSSYLTQYKKWSCQSATNFWKRLISLSDTPDTKRLKSLFLPNTVQEMIVPISDSPLGIGDCVIQSRLIILPVLHRASRGAEWNIGSDGFIADIVKGYGAELGMVYLHFGEMSL